MPGAVGVPGAARRRLAVTIMAMAIAVGLALPSSGSVIEKISIARLQDEAEAIAIARVISSKSVSRGGTIQTETLLSIDQSWRGPKKGTLLVRTAGGRAPNGMTLLALGEAQFPADQRVLVFLYRSGEAWRPVGMFQGVWLVGKTEPEIRNLDKTQDEHEAPPDRAERLLVRPSRANGARLLALEPGPYAVDGGPRLITELIGNLAGGGR